MCPPYGVICRVVASRRRGCPQIIILQGFLLLLTHLFIEGVSNRRDFIYVHVFAGVRNPVLVAKL